MSALTLSPTPTQKKPKRQILVKAEQFFIGNFDTLVCEFLGSSLFTFLGSASSNVASSGLGPAFGNAISLTSVLYLLSNDEGSGKLNPAASLSFLLAGKSSVIQCVWEVIVQICGALAGAALLNELSPNAKNGCFIPTTSDAKVFAFELIGTCLLLGVCYSTSTKKYSTTAPLAIGLSLFAAAQAVGPFTGGCLNPARYVANIGLGCNAKKFIPYISAQLLAAVVAAMYYWMQILLDGVREKRKFDQIHSSDD